MKQEEILIENKTENTALEAQMSETIGITGGIASILTGTTGQFETLGSICAGVMLVENTAQIFHSVPNEGARYGKLGPTKIRAEPYIGQYDKTGRRKVRGLKHNSRQMAAGGKGD